MKLYLTKATVSVVAKSSTVKVTKSEFESLQRYLTGSMLGNLWKLNGLKSEDFLKKKFILKNYHDPKTHINPPSVPAYHLNESCPFLKNDYFNWPIPQEIKNKGLEDEYRTWFKDYVELLKRNTVAGEERFRREHNKKWGFFYKGKTIHLENSGKEMWLSNSKKEVQEKLELWYAKLNKWLTNDLMNGNDLFREYLSRYPKIQKDKHQSRRIKVVAEEYGDDLDTVLDWLEYYRKEFQWPLRAILEDLIYFDLTEDNMWDEVIVEKMGLRPCSKCIGQGDNKPH